MNYYFFYQRFIHLPLFSVHDIRKTFPDFDTRRLVEWQQKGYVQKIVNRWYRFADQPVDELYLWYVSNRIYQPSYVSMESALSFYGLIPEAVCTLTSVSSLKTQRFETPLGVFAYHHIKPSLIFGYRLIAWKSFQIRMAEPEKLMLDYLYLHPKLTDLEDFIALRINTGVLAEILDVRKIHRYLILFNQKSLSRRTHNFLKLLKHAEPH